MLSRYLQQTNCQVYHSTADADLLIVNKAVQRSKTMENVLVGDDTELLILLCYHAELDVFDLFFQPEPKANSTKRRSWNIKSAKEKLGQEICRHILFIHAISGCDTTSRLYRIGKGLPLKKFVSNTHFREHVKVFDSLPVSKEEIVKAGEQVLVCLYNGKPEEGLDGLRFRCYCEKVSTGTSQIQPQSLPPILLLLHRTTT